MNKYKLGLAMSVLALGLGLGVSKARAGDACTVQCNEEFQACLLDGHTPKNVCRAILFYCVRQCTIR
ncbi:hypothetical protein [Pseudomarimonas arenosa]|uniref:Uncharacterized protein n=1 Tax=Pseudomarimonas arenosa TaxID=2774145 RepID=A0AAW3ZIW2_9GAMM|nr:hypothetical protein [Pseudomarimonas arenosa]MBD8525087.1 hypothetical protein [Pseudomarimonas arenosa]